MWAGQYLRWRVLGALGVVAVELLLPVSPHLRASIVKRNPSETMRCSRVSLSNTTAYVYYGDCIHAERERVVGLRPCEERCSRAMSPTRKRGMNNETVVVYHTDYSNDTVDVRYQMSHCTVRMFQHFHFLM